MKRTTLFFAMASLLWCLAAWAEEPDDYEYVPLVREGIEWTYFVSYSSTDIEPYYFHMQFYGGIRRYIVKSTLNFTKNQKCWSIIMERG